MKYSELLLGQRHKHLPNSTKKDSRKNHIEQGHSVIHISFLFKNFYNFFYLGVHCWLPMYKPTTNRYGWSPSSLLLHLWRSGWPHQQRTISIIDDQENEVDTAGGNSKYKSRRMQEGKQLCSCCTGNREKLAQFPCNGKIDTTKSEKLELQL